MIKTDFSPAPKQKNVITPFFSLPTVLYGLNFGVLGAMANAFLSLQFFGDFSLFFGQIFVLFCLVTRGLNAAIISTVIVSTTTAVYANDPYLIVILLLEMLFVHVSMRRGYFLFQSAMSYWLFIGIPLFLILHALTSFASHEVLFIGAVSRAFNGLICVSVVAIFCWFLPSHFIYPKYYSRPPQLASLIFSLCMLTITLPAMLISLFFIWQSSVHNELEVNDALQNAANSIAATNEIEIRRHLDSLDTLTTILENNPSARLQPLLTATTENYSLFDSMIMTDQYGRIMRAAPAKFSVKLTELNYPNVQKRSYFKQAMSATRPFVNDAIKGQGFGDDFIICFVSPLFNNGSFNGVVQGAMLLTDFSEFNNKQNKDNYQFVITDTKSRIIARSNDIDMPLLSNFDYVDYHDPLVTRVPSLSIGGNKYLYKQIQTSNGWTITVLESPTVLIDRLVKYFFVLVVATSIVLTAFALIAKSLSRKITKPLVDIAENFPNSELHPQIIRESQVSSEMVKLTHKLIDSHEVMSNFHQQLSEQVHVKTKQLKQLNRELYSIAQKDSLTQLLNRAGFNRLAITSFRNCIRNNINVSLILMDIDHFKQINDTHGHPFGDKCIVAVAKTILQHCKRDTDIIGRYGGEEFIVMIVGGEIKEHNERVALIKDGIEKLRLHKDRQTVKMTISAGICSISENFSIEYEDLLQLADNQLYISKREGRNKISAINQ